MAVDFDLILPDVGEYGTYQKLMVWLVFLPGMIPCGFHAYNQLFMATQPKFRCLVPDLDTSIRNLTDDFIRNISIPVVLNKNGRLDSSSCSMYQRNFSVDEEDVDLNAPIVACNAGWKFQHSDPDVTTVVADWELVCDKDFYTTLALVLFGVSGLIGNWIFGYMQDSMGRRPAFFIYLLIESIFGIATAFAPSFAIWLAFRVGVGFTVPAIMGTPLIMAIELVGPTWRTHVALLANVVYSFTLCLLGLVVWLVKDWRHMSLATSLPFLSFFFYWWVMPESPRWLLSQNRLAEAETVIRKMAHVNKKTLPPGYFNQFKNDLEEKNDKPGSGSAPQQQTFGALDLVKTPNMARKTTVITFIWYFTYNIAILFTVTSVYVGLSYYAPALGGNEYLNFFLAGAAELPTYFFLWPTMDRWGRRWTLCLSMIIGGVACLATLSFQNDYIATLILYCVGKFGISSAFVVLPLMASELYPTVVRGIGISISGVAGMLGPIFIPLINYLGTESLMVLPLMIMGGLMVAGGLAALTLPETLHQHLPQTLEEGELFGWFEYYGFPLTRKDFGYKQWLTCCPSRQTEIDDPDQRTANNVEVAEPLLSPVTNASIVTSPV